MNGLVPLFAWTALGVLISFALPPLLRAAGVARPQDSTASVPAFWTRVQAFLSSRYVIVTVLSLVLALLVVAILDDEITTWNLALVSGLGWQSILARTLSPGS